MMFKNLLNLLIVASLTVGVGVTLTACADKAPIPTEQNLIVKDSIFDEIVNNTLFRVEKQSLVNKINDLTNQIKNLDKNIDLTIAQLENIKVKLEIKIKKYQDELALLNADLQKLDELVNSFGKDKLKDIKPFTGSKTDWKGKIAHIKAEFLRIIGERKYLIKENHSLIIQLIKLYFETEFDFNVHKLNTGNTRLDAYNKAKELIKTLLGDDYQLLKISFKGSETDNLTGNSEWYDMDITIGKETATIRFKVKNVGFIRKSNEEILTLVKNFLKIRYNWGLKELTNSRSEAIALLKEQLQKYLGKINYDQVSIEDGTPISKNNKLTSFFGETDLDLTVKVGSLDEVSLSLYLKGLSHI